MAATRDRAGLPRLGDPVAADEAVAGRKAARLSRLVRAGFRVPEGVVIGTETLEARDCGALAREVMAAVGSGPFAVRSSALAEDLADASYAGLYASLLDVAGAEPLAAAIDRCRRSAGCDQVRAYHPAGSAMAVAVLVQRMVAADAAGVAFTLDPVSGARDVAVVEAVMGLGDQLVSGTVEPQRWRIVAEEVVGCHGPPVLSEGQVRSVVATARRVEELFGLPQDIEWAIDGDGLWLLQARPVTGLTRGDDGPALVPIPIEVPPGSWQRFTVHTPAPMSPLAASDTHSSWPTVLAEFGILVDVEFAVIGGWGYGQIRPVGAPKPRARSRPPRTLPTARSAPPRWLLRLLLNLVPAVRRRIRAAEAAAAGDLSGRLIDRWYDEWRPEVAAEVAPLTELDLTAFADDELDRHLEAVLDGTHRWGHVHVRLGVAWSVIMYELCTTCRDLLAWDEGESLGLLSGLSAASTEPARQLASVAGLAAQRPRVRSLLRDIDLTTRQRIAAADPDFAAAFDDYLTHYAARALRYELMDPTLREDPHLLFRLIRDQLDVGFDPTSADARVAAARQAALARVHRLLAPRPQADRDRLERALARAQRAHPVREDNEWFTTSVWIALMRYAALEYGRRLTQRRLLERAADVFMLTLDELRAALHDGSGLGEVARRRRGQHAWAIANPGPDYYGNTPTPDTGDPPFDLLPPGARLVNEAAMWAVAANGEVPNSDATETAVGLEGVAASAGRYTGPVRIIMGEHEFAKLRPGDVVVCPVTAPVWSVLYPSMGAMVTDHGGILSHPAIIAREYGLPAVVGTQLATSTLHDGDLVTVDGSRGTVELHG